MPMSESVITLLSATLPRTNTHKPIDPKTTGRPSQPSRSGADDLVLFGDVEALKDAFRNAHRRMISASVPDSILMKLQGYPGGVSRFLEDAVAAFDGDLKTLVEAAVVFVENRRLRAPEDPARNASARVLPSTFDKIQKIHAALACVRGMSRAKVLSGLIGMKLGHDSKR